LAAVAMNFAFVLIELTTINCARMSAKGQVCVNDVDFAFLAESTHGQPAGQNHSIFPNLIAKCYNIFQKNRLSLRHCVRTMAKPRQNRPIRRKCLNDSCAP